VDLSRATFTTARRRAYYRDARERVAALPGVRGAAWISGVPFGFDQDQTAVHPEGAAAARQDQDRVSLNVSVTPEYFAAAGVAFVSGRAFDGRDTADAPPVAIVNDTLARQLWPGANPIGRRVQLAESGTVVEVIGVVKDGKYILLWEAPRAMLFQPLAQATPDSATLELVTAGAPIDAGHAVRVALQAVDPDVPVYRFQSMADYLEYGQAFLIFRIGALFAGVFGAMGLILASIGLYGVVSYDITQRTHEIGVRMALGALRADILREVISRGARLAVPGALLGMAIAAGVARMLRMLFLDVSPFDPFTYGGTAVALLAVCLLASFMPALRAASASPLEALRAD
jgi:predicted permease